MYKADRNYSNGVELLKESLKITKIAIFYQNSHLRQIFSEKTRKIRLGGREGVFASEILRNLNNVRSLNHFNKKRSFSDLITQLCENKFRFIDPLADISSGRIRL